MLHPVLPPAAIGILGNGQLGRMLALAARRMGYRVHVLGPGKDSPAGQAADREYDADYTDSQAIARFAGGVEAVTLEFENVPVACAQQVAQHVPVRPSAHILGIAQNRLREKRFLRDAGLPVPRFVEVSSSADLAKAAGSVGYPAVLKSAGFGYDGKGQAVVRGPEDLRAAWQRVTGHTAAVDAGALAILEELVDFEFEASVLVARGGDGQMRTYPPSRNRHRHHILDVSVAPLATSPLVDQAAQEAGRRIAERLDLTGLICAELFVTADQQVLVNEIAPRPHNSGHLTIEGCATSQFEQVIRALCDLPLGDTQLHRPAAMANLLGDLWEHGPPAWELALGEPGVALHLYGKQDARPGRKMGHLTALADTPGEAELRVTRARQKLLKPRL